MGFVVGDLILLTVIVAVTGMLIVKASAKRDIAKMEELKFQGREARLRAERDAVRRAPGVRLICLNCDIHFDGPLTDLGCPKCHLSTLVVAEEELPTPPE